MFQCRRNIQRNNPTTTTCLYDITQWRDTTYPIPTTITTTTDGIAIPKIINILPFSYTEVLLQGETKQLRLYEDRFVQLFEHSQKYHAGVVAMGLLADTGIVQVVSLCEIEAYNRMEGFGIFVTLRVVARGTVLELTQQEPYLQAIVTERTDTLPPNLELYVSKK